MAKKNTHTLILPFFHFGTHIFLALFRLFCQHVVSETTLSNESWFSLDFSAESREFSLGQASWARANASVYSSNCPFSSDYTVSVFLFGHPFFLVLCVFFLAVPIPERLSLIFPGKVDVFFSKFTPVKQWCFSLYNTKGQKIQLNFV